MGKTKMRKTGMALLALILWLGCLTDGMAAERKINLATLNWMPYSGRFMPNYGIGPEIITQALTRKGFATEYFFMAWVKVLEEVKKGNYDAMANAYYTAERARTYLASESYLDSPVALFKRKDRQIKWTGSLKELKPYKIGVVKGYATSPEFDAADFLNKRASKTEILNIRKLILKQADLIVMDRFVGEHLIREKLPAHERDLLAPLSPPLNVNKLHLMFSRNIPDAQQKLEVFNSGLKEIQKDGTLMRILEKYGFNR